ARIKFQSLMDRGFSVLQLPALHLYIAEDQINRRVVRSIFGAALNHRVQQVDAFFVAFQFAEEKRLSEFKRAVFGIAAERSPGQIESFAKAAIFSHGFDRDDVEERIVFVYSAPRTI